MSDVGKRQGTIPAQEGSVAERGSAGLGLRAIAEARTGFRRLRQVVLVTVVGCMVGCGREDPATDQAPTPASGFSPRDSAGILISVTPGGEARAPIGWTVDSLPELVIGAADDPSQGLYRVQGLDGLPGGGVVVVDAGSRELRFFDSLGQLESRVGRKGEGPGEFDDPVLVPMTGVDSLLLWDNRLLRFQVFSRDGRDHRTVLLRERWPAGGRAPIGAIGLHQMLVRRYEATWFVPASEQTTGAKRDTVDYIWYDPATGAETAIASVLVTRTFVYKSRGRPPVSDMIPFAANPSAAVTSDGMVLANGPISEARDFDPEGRLRRIFRVEEQSRPITSEMVDAFIAERLSGTPSGSSRDFLREFLSAMPIPDSLPAFEELLVDSQGWLWAETYDRDPYNPGSWMIFDRDGRARGTIQTPPGLQVKKIGDDFILGIWVDDLGVEYVRRYRLRRGS